MSKAFSPIALRPPRSLAAFAVPRSRAWYLDWTNVENEMARAFDAIRECARIAWWDGSAIGLHLHGVFDLFDLLDTQPNADREDGL